jgi:hypothetical protein
VEHGLQVHHQVRRDAVERRALQAFEPCTMSCNRLLLAHHIGKRSCGLPLEINLCIQLIRGTKMYN